MYLEKRKAGKSIKYYLTHSYRNENNEVIKIRRFLGSNLTQREIERLQPIAKKALRSHIDEMNTSMFDFSLSSKQIKSLNRYDEKIEVVHLTKSKWQHFTEEFVYNTNAIEGSTVLKKDVLKILAKKNTRDPEEIETKGVAKAIEFLRKTKQELTLNLILKIHKFCFEDSKDFAGKLRDVEVVIKDRNSRIIHAGTPAKELENAMKDYITWYKNNKDKFKPLALAAIVHNQFEGIHPFQDGNGRVGRLLLNFILIRNKYPPINISLEDRAEYYSVLQKYSMNDKLIPTLKFLIKQYKKTLKQVTTGSKK